MADVFLSYAKKDAEWASLFVAALNSSGISCWYDREIEPDDNWRTRIESELEAARCCVVLWSQNAVSSRFVVSEAERAERQDKLVQLRIERIDPPIGFNATQYHDFVGWDGRPHDARWGRLVESIRRVQNGERVGYVRSGAVAASSKAANAWRHVLDSTDAAEYRSFIERYPDDPLVRLANERLADIAAWNLVDRSNPQAIRAFILEGPFDGLLDLARAALPMAERRVLDAAAARQAAVAAEQQRWQDQMAQETAQREAARKREEEAKERAEIDRINSVSRRQLFLLSTLLSIPAFLVAATFVATQLESFVGHSPGHSAPTRALNPIESAIVLAFSVIGWSWPDERSAVLGVPFGEVFFLTSACALVGLIFHSTAFAGEWRERVPLARGYKLLAAWAAGVAGLWVAAYCAAAALPSVLTTPVLWLVNLFLLLVLILWPVIELIRVMIRAPGVYPYGCITVLVLVVISLLFTQSLFDILPGR